jgi:UDP-glucose 4-epimerase
VRILVTGASGQLGSYVARRLLEQGHSVSILTRPSSDLWRLEGVQPHISIIHGDLASVDDAAAGIAEAAPEAVVHCGWSGVTGAGREGDEQVQLNLLGTLRLLDIVRDVGCRAWVGVGSQAEYGPQNIVLNEDSPVEPVSLYGVSKLCVGLLTRELCQRAGMRYVWMRLFATYGPRDDPRHLIPSTIIKLLARQRPELTRGEQRWDYLYIEDAADAIFRAAIEDRAEGVFVLGSGAARSVRSIVETIRDLVDPALELGLGEVPDRIDGLTHLQADVTRLQRVLDWQPQVSLEQGLAHTVDWYRAASPLTETGALADRAGRATALSSKGAR